MPRARSETTPLRSPAARNARAALLCVALLAGMGGLAYASVPLYRLFCQVTGFDGTPQRAQTASRVVLDREVTVRFDANVRGLPWTFRPEQVSQDIRIGETGLAFYSVTNTGDQPVTGSATYNVVPEQAGPYFTKLECFCFTDQTIQPGQTVEFPVVYYVDPQYADDFNTRGKSEITLSYTFYPKAGGQDGARADAAVIKAPAPLGGKPRAGL